MILLLLACEGKEAAGSGFASWKDYAGLVGTHYDFAKEGAEGAGDLLEIDAGEDAWTLTPAGTVATTRKDGFYLDDVPVLPSRMSGEIGQVEVWYGSFPLAATVTVDEGEWAGGHAYAKGVGPILLTLDEQVWELVYYE